MSGYDIRGVSAPLLGATLVLLLWGASLARASNGEPPTASARSAIEASRPPRSHPGRATWRRRWIASWLVVAAVNALDIHSSLGHGEANALYRSRDGRFAPGKAVAIKSAITGGLFVSQLLLFRSNPEKNFYQPFTWTNAVTAGALGGVVAHNYSLERPRPATERAVPSHLAPQP